MGVSIRVQSFFVVLSFSRDSSCKSWLTFEYRAVCMIVETSFYPRGIESTERMSWRRNKMEEFPLVLLRRSWSIGRRKLWSTGQSRFCVADMRLL